MKMENLQQQLRVVVNELNAVKAEILQVRTDRTTLRQQSSDNCV